MQVCDSRFLISLLTVQIVAAIVSPAFGQTPTAAPTRTAPLVRRPFTSTPAAATGASAPTALRSRSPVRRRSVEGGAQAGVVSAAVQERAKEINRQAIALQQEGKLTEACALYRQAIALNPGGAGYHNNLALVLKDLDQAKEAEVEEKIALKLRPKRADYLVNLGIILQRQKRFTEAEAAFKDALAIDAGDSDCNFRLGQTYYELGDYAQAIDATKLALMLKPENAEFHELMGDIYTKSSKIDDAMIEYRRVIEINGYTPATIAGALKAKIDYLKTLAKIK